MEGFELFGQGAEARLYIGYYLGKRSLAKERFKKNYRHPELDNRLTKERIKGEARAIVRAKAAGVATPALYLVDTERQIIFMEYIDDAETLKSFIDKRSEQSTDNEDWINHLAEAIARILVKLHTKNIIHGDLTTSNILIRRCNDFEKNTSHDVREDVVSLVLIDFGLARVESTSEDKAVDLYVLERSLLSSHSQHTSLFPAILTNYIKNMIDKKQRGDIIAKYEDVRARGRKRLMIG